MELRFKAQLIVRITEWSKRYIVVWLVVILRRVLLLSSDGLGTVSSLGGRNCLSSFISFLRLCRFKLVSRLWFGSLHDNLDTTNELINCLVNEHKVFFRHRIKSPVQSVEHRVPVNAHQFSNFLLLISHLNESLSCQILDAECLLFLLHDIKTTHFSLLIYSGNRDFQFLCNGTNGHSGSIEFRDAVIDDHALFPAFLSLVLLTMVPDAEVGNDAVVDEDTEHVTVSLGACNRRRDFAFFVTLWLRFALALLPFRLGFGILESTRGNAGECFNCRVLARVFAGGNEMRNFLVRKGLRKSAVDELCLIHIRMTATVIAGGQPRECCDVFLRHTDLPEGIEAPVQSGRRSLLSVLPSLCNCSERQEDADSARTLPRSAF